MPYARILFFLVVTTLLASFLENAWADEDDWFDKHMSFWDGKGKIGGEMRIRGESFDDFDFDDDVNTPARDDDFILSRVRLSLDLQPIDPIRLYIQIQDSHQFETDVPTAFRAGPSAREDRVDIHQGFLDVRPFSAIPVTVRMGRQELNYGNQRLIGGFGWSNVGRSFEGIKVMYNSDSLFADIFAANVVKPEDKHFNDPVWDDDFYGLYAGWKKFPAGVLEVYLLFRDNDDTGRELYTFGTRLQGNLLPSKALDYSAELAFQTGDFTDGMDHNAFATHIGTGYTFKECRITPRLGVEYNYSTGDEDPDDGENETFDNLFPTNHIHYGHMDLFSWRNIHNLRFNVSAKPTDKLTLKCDLHFFWLDETEDAWFNAGGAVVRPGTTADVDNFVGEELDLTASYRHNDHLSFLAGYSRFFPGGFVDDTGPDDNANWAYIQMVFAF